MTQKLLVWSKENTPLELHSILEILACEYSISSVNGEFELKFSKTDCKGKSAVKFNEKVIQITYNTTASACRAIANALAGLESDESIEFKTYGIMLDCSRNAVMTVKHFKSWLRQLALMGYNMAMLYTEDTYQLPDEPFFGYKRGPYTLEEIKEIDAYAKALGIDIIACLQTLGHMGNMLQWNIYDAVKDTANVMCVDEEKTYALIDKMLSFWSEGLSNNRIHIGMDETHDLGRGKFMDNKGYERGFDIFNRHFAKVEKMCEKYNLRPMIWSDMYFRMSNPKLEYYDLESEIPKDIIDIIPKNSDLVYWDYYHTNQEFYEKFIDKHRALGYEPLMGSGLWTWGRIWNDHDIDVKTVKPCIKACRAKKLDEVFFTIWGDSGAYCEINSVLADLCWAADLAYGGNEDAVRLEAQFKTITGGSYNNHMIAARLSAHILEGDEANIGLCANDETVGSPFLLWDDPMLGICWDSKNSQDSNFVNKTIELYNSICEDLADQRTDNSAGDINHAWLYANFLRQKIAFRRDFINAYESDNKLILANLAEDTLPQMLSDCEAITASLRKMWHKYFKPFGLEVIQIRQAGQEARIKETKLRIEEYLNGVIDSIPELEARATGKVHDHDYHYIASGATGI